MTATTFDPPGFHELRPRARELLDMYWPRGQCDLDPATKNLVIEIIAAAMLESSRKTEEQMR